MTDKESRSVQKRKALQQGKPMPQFDKEKEIQELSLIIKKRQTECQDCGSQ